MYVYSYVVLLNVHNLDIIGSIVYQCQNRIKCVYYYYLLVVASYRELND